MKISSLKIKSWAKLGQRGTVFGIVLPELAKQKANLKLLTADVALLSGMERFCSQYPEQFLNVGIAEQNMIGIAAGLALEGDIVFATTYASFLAVRCLEQVRQHLAYMKNNVKLISFSAGMAAAKSGVSHWATEDIAFMNALPNMVVMSPADSLEALKMTEWAAEYEGPVYIRLSGGVDCPIVYENDYDWQAGKIITLTEGREVALIATGLMVKEALAAEKILAEKGISCSVYNLHTIKPLDREKLRAVFQTHSLIVSIEEHNVIGGIGSAIAQYKSELTNMPRQVMIGVEDFAIDAGGQKYIWSEIGLTAEKIADRVKKEWEKTCDC